MDLLNMKPLSFFGIGVFLFLSLGLQAQNTPFFSAGTNFSFPYLGVDGIAGSGMPRKRVVQITAATPTCGFVEVPEIGFRLDFWLEKDSVLLVKLPHYTGVIGRVLPLGVTVKSKFPVQVVQATDINRLDSLGGYAAHQTDCVNTEATAIGPLIAAQKDYWLTGPNFMRKGLPSALTNQHRAMQFWAYTPFDSAQVAIRLNGKSTTPFSLTPLTVDTFFYPQMESGDAFHSYSEYDTLLSVKLKNRSYSGSTVKGLNKPILLFAGTPSNIWGDCSSFSARSTMRKETYEQVKPNSVGDTMFLVNQMLNHHASLYSIMALHDSTAIFINGQLIGWRNKSYQLDTCWLGEAVITASKPVQLMLTRNTPWVLDSTRLNSSVFSGFSINVAGSNELIKRSVLKPFIGNYGVSHMVALYTPTQSTGSFTLDGQVLQPSVWQTYASHPAWSYAEIEIDDNTHVLETSAEGFTGYHFSYMKKTKNFFDMPAYGYCLGESGPIPQDSVSFYIKKTEGRKVKFRDFNDLLCVGESFTLYPNVGRNTSWYWNFGDGSDTVQQIAAERGVGISHRYLLPGKYWIKVNDVTRCFGADSVQIEVVQAPEVVFDYSFQVSCKGIVVQLDNQTVGAKYYSWRIEGKEFSNDESTFLEMENGRNVTVTLDIESNSGCQGTVSKVLVVDTTQGQSMVVPNVFTPNGDGLNDCFYVESSEGFSQCFELNIYNRWGVNVFKSNNPSDCWTGNNHSDGTYFYVAKVGPQELKGHVLLIR